MPVRESLFTLLVTTVFRAQDAQRPLTVTPKTHAAAQKHTAVKPGKSFAKAQTKKSSAFAFAAEAPAEKKEHRLILQVNSNDPAAMNLALNNAMNVARYCKETGENVKIEVVAFGPGLHMLRDDTSPVKCGS